MSIRPRRIIAASTAFSLVLSALSFLAATSLLALAGGVALASPASAAPTSGPVSADGLPTVQINGVVWRQAIAGNVAFAGGEFTNARPAGAAPGVNTVPRTNLLAYDIRTGDLIASFNPVLNGKVNDLAVTPDGTKLVVGGQFTTVNGLNRYRVAVFDLSGTDTSTPTITLNSTFAPSVDGSVYGVAASNSSVFVGGQFAVAGKQARSRFASFSITNGALLPAVIPVDDQSVKSIVVSPDGSRVVISGAFTSVGGSSNPGYGIYMADAQTGAGLPLPVNSEVRDGGANSAILHVATDGTYFYGGGYKFNAGGASNSEGTFQAKWSDGSLVTLEDCHGDTYDIAPVGDLVYKASHKHYCGNSGGFPQTDPWTRWDATAWTKTVEGSPNLKDVYGYGDHPGTPHPGLAAFFPQTDVGTYTGKGQSVWTVTGNSQYVIYGGEFPKVNGVAQQGLVRYAVRSIAPNSQGPRTTDTSTFTATAKSLEPGKVRVTWPTLWDKDDTTLSYDLYRDGTKIYSTTATAYQWDGYQMTYDDTGRTAGTTPSYQVRVTDPSGNMSTSTSATATVAGTDSVGSYASQVLADGASKYWRLGESGSTVNDLGGSDNTTTGSTVTRGATGALNSPTDTIGKNDDASTFDGTSNGRISSSQLVNTTSKMSEELWFKTTSVSGKLAGYGNVQTGSSSLYDRHIYMSSSKVCFGVTTTSNQAICSPKSYADGAWHQVVATLGSNGMLLYVDDAAVASNPAVTYGRPYPAYFRIGGDNTWSGNQNFKGQIDEVAVYPSQLTAQQVDNHWVASGRTGTNPPANASPTASFTSSHTDLTASFDASGSSDSDGTVASYAWSWGDGSSAGSGKTPTHAYAQAGTYPVTLTVTDNDNATGSVTNNVTVTAPPPTNQAPIASFTSSHTDLTASFDATGSSDPDGSVASYSWNFGDSKSGTGATPSHDYAQAGTYSVTLTVTDNKGAPGTTTKTVTVTDPTPPPGNQPPTASFTASTTNRSLSVDASASKDPDGTIASYSWNWGDTTTAGTGVTANHTYAADGTYTVTLTVTDDDGDSTSTAQSVSASAPPTATTLARDDFNRTTSNGWGSATSGGAWTLGAAKTQYSVSPGAGKINIPTSGRPTADLKSISATDTDTTVEFSVDKVVDATYVGINGRTVGSNFYNSRIRISANGTVQLYLLRTSTAIGAAYTVPGMVIAPGTHYKLRFQVMGTSPTTLSAKVWKASDPEPGAWQLSRPDTLSPAIPALQGPGYVGLYNYIPGSGPMNTSFYSYLVTDSAPAVDQVPTASFTSSHTDLTASFDASGSSDSDGTVASYAWSWGDGSSAGSGKTPTHAYAQAGTYPVTLTVTDDDGATGSVTNNVTVTAPSPTNQAPIASFTSSHTDLTASFDATGSSDPDGSVASYSWNFGDSKSGTGATPSHDYAQAGTYSVTLTVTDNKGAPGTTTKTVTVTDPTPPPGNQPPTASFSSSTAGLTASFNATASNDPDGTIASYSWNWGDNTTAGSGATPSHDYTAAGTYTVTLTVTDDEGATATVNHNVTVETPPTATILARDDFNRTTSNGWGSATSGGAWTLSAAKTQYSVVPGAGKIAIPTSGRPLADLKSISATDTDTTVEFSVDKVVDATYVGINGRTVGSNFYNSRIRIAADGTVQLYLLRTSTAIGAAYTVPGMVIAPGTHYKLRFQVMGTSPTTLSAKVWKASDPEPGAWQLSRPDTLSPAIPALQGPGYVGLYTYIPGSGPMNTSFYSYLLTNGA